MRLILFHPEVAYRPCTECKKWLFADDGALWKRRDEPEGTRYERPPGTPTPCGTCPKESPQKAREHELSERNRRTWHFYRQVQATHGACLTDAMKTDRLLLENLATCETINAQWRERQQVSVAVATVTALLGGKR